MSERKEASDCRMSSGVARLAGVTRRFGELYALSGIDITLGNQEVVGLLGPNGAGKTTLLRVLCGYLIPDEGEVTVCGADMLADPVTGRKEVGYMPERAPAYGEMTVTEYIDFVAACRGIAAGRRDKVERALERSGTHTVSHRLVRNLSKGYRQRLALAAAIVGEPRLIILDEPGTGLDPNQMYELRQLIVSLGNRHTVLVSSHIMQEIEAVSDRVLILDNGKLVADGSAGELLGSDGTAFEALVVGASADRLEELVRSFSGNAVVIERSESGTRIRFEPGEQAEQSVVFDWAVSNGVSLSEIVPVRRGLESLFRRLTAGVSDESTKGAERK